MPVMKFLAKVWLTMATPGDFFVSVGSEFAAEESGICIVEKYFGSTCIVVRCP